MINESTIRKFAERDDNPYWIDEHGNIVDKERNLIVTTVEELTKRMQKKLHCDFQVVHYGNAILSTIYRCNECGTVIFAREDEDYDPNLCCPVCGGYETSFEYWPGTGIESDIKKQNTIKLYEQMQKEDEEAYARYKKRGDKWDWQICECSIKLPKKKLYFKLECDNLFKTKLKGLRLQVMVGYKDECCYVIKKRFTIPLSWSSLKVQMLIRRRYKNGKVSN